MLFCIGRRKYIFFPLDRCYLRNTKNTPFTRGPWDNFTYGQNRFIVTPDITASTIFDGVLASVQGLYLLHAQPDVIREKVGIVGISWGGYLTTMVSGLANSMVTASYSVFGSGFYDATSVFVKELNKMLPEDRSLWLKYLDAGRRARSIHTPFFIAAATNDNWFYPMAVKNTLQYIAGPVNHVFSPNVSHKINLPGGTENKRADTPGWTEMEEFYFDYYLKGKGRAFPKIKTLQVEKSNENKLLIRFKVESSNSIQLAQVSFSPVGEYWTKRNWQTVAAKNVEKDWYIAEVDVKALKNVPIEFFATVSDDRPVSVSSNMIWYTYR